MVEDPKNTRAYHANSAIINHQEAYRKKAAAAGVSADGTVGDPLSAQFSVSDKKGKETPQFPSSTIDVSADRNIIPDVMLDHGSQVLFAAQAEVNQKAKFFATGKHAWAKEFFDPKASPQSLVERDISGADIVSSLSGRSRDEIKGALDNGLAALKKRAETIIGITSVEASKEREESYGYREADAKAKAAQKSVEDAEKNVAKAKSDFDDGLKAAKESAEAKISAKEDEHKAALVKLDAENKRQLEAERKSRFTDEYARLRDEDPRSANSPEEAAAIENEIRAQAEANIALNVKNFEDEQVRKRRDVVAAQGEELAATRNAAEAERKAEQARLENKYRTDLYSSLQDVSKATQDVGIAEASANVARARTDLENAKNSPQDAKRYKEALVEAERDLHDREHVRAEASVEYNSSELKVASSYRQNVVEGKAARESLKADSIDEFLTKTEVAINAQYDKKINALSSLQEKERENLQMEKKHLLEKLSAVRDNEALTAQMAFIHEQVEKIRPAVSEQTKMDIRAEMFNGALRHIEQEKHPADFAKDFLRQSKHEALKNLIPASLSDLGIEHPDQVLKMSIKKDTVEVHFRGKDGHTVPKVVLTGAAAQRVMEHGLDLSELSREHSFFLNVDASTGIGRGGKELVLHGAREINIQMGITGTDKPERKAEGYAAMKSAGGNNEIFDETAGMKMANNSIKKPSTNQLALKLDTDKDGHISREEALKGVQDMASAMDKNKDGYLSAAEIKQNRNLMLAMKSLGNASPDIQQALAQIQNMNGGDKNAKINIAELGNLASQQIASTDQPKGKGRG